jgi:hypothetical protein
VEQQRRQQAQPPGGEPQRALLQCRQPQAAEPQAAGPQGAEPQEIAAKGF